MSCQVQEGGCYCSGLEWKECEALVSVGAAAKLTKL